MVVESRLIDVVEGRPEERRWNKGLSDKSWDVSLGIFVFSIVQ